MILRGPRKRLELTGGPEGWKDFLAEPDKHWKDGRSAKLLAEAWEDAAPDMPGEIRSALARTPFQSFLPILAIPEYEVALPGGRRPSQNDLFVLGRISSDLAVVMVEGKVDESFGPLVEDWLKGASRGKLRRLEYLRQTLGLDGVGLDSLRYQLLHRTASPIIEATRLRARYAAMVVHSFSPIGVGLEDYRAFAGRLGIGGTAGRLEKVSHHGRPELWLGWVEASAR